MNRKNFTAFAPFFSSHNWIRFSAGKCPLQADGRFARVNDPSTWATFAEAEASNAGVGIGLVLTADLGLTCIDFDNVGDCRGGNAAPWVEECLEQLGPTYVEVSPSGNGLHAWALGQPDLPKVKGKLAEVYRSKRYLTVTGEPFRGSILEIREIAQLEEVCRVLVA